MSKYFSRSCWIMAALTFVVFTFVTINEDWSVRIACWVIFPVMVLLISMPCSRISRLIIEKGDAIRDGFKRAIFYIVLPLGSLIVFAVILTIAYAVEDNRASTGDFTTELGWAILFVFVMTVIFILILIPHIQTYIVLLLRKTDKNKASR